MRDYAVFTPKMEDLHFEARKSYDYFRIEGVTLDYHVLKACLQQIAKRKGVGKSKCVLVENNYRENLSLVDLFRVINDLPAMGFSRMHLAIADPNPGHPDNNEFANTVASNRGLQMRAFSSVHDAEGWLKGC